MTDRKIDPFDSPESSESGFDSEMGVAESGEAESVSGSRDAVCEVLKSSSAGRSRVKSDRISQKIGERASAKPEHPMRFIDLYDLSGMLEDK